VPVSVATVNRFYYGSDYDWMTLVDIDSDGDLDIFVAPPHQEMSWFENRETNDGRTVFRWQHVVDTGAYQYRELRVADMDDDGDWDVLVAYSDYSQERIDWYENTDGLGTLKRKSGVTTGGQVSSLDTADMDNDGDLDVLAVSWESEPSYPTATFWHENTDGHGTLGPRQVLADEGRNALVLAGDVDGDGDVDVVWSSTDKIVWYENLTLQSHAGDANRDGRFDQLDIVAVLQSANYMTGQPAAWSDGDWNHDGVFDQLDIVAALQTGNYLQGTHAAVTCDLTSKVVALTERFPQAPNPLDEVFADLGTRMP
jgi:hypothetical protein